MKKQQKLAAMVLVGAMCASLTACGSSNTAATTAAPADTTAGTTAAPAAETPKEETEAKAAAESYDITWVTCSTQSEFWQYQQIGMENAAKDMEEKYGIKINFSTVGPATEAETEAYIRAFENAIASKPAAIISATQVPDSTRTVAKEAMDQGIVVNFTNG